MITKIANLSSQLREEGLPVSIRSTQAAVQIYQDLGQNDRQLLKTALMAVYVKDRYDIPKFNKIFEKIFKEEKTTYVKGIYGEKAPNGTQEFFVSATLGLYFHKTQMNKFHSLFS